MVLLGKETCLELEVVREFQRRQMDRVYLKAINFLENVDLKERLRKEKGEGKYVFEGR